MAGSIILRISYGYHALPCEDPFIKLANEATEQFALATSPGGFLANLVPPRACDSLSLKDGLKRGLLSSFPPRLVTGSRLQVYWARLAGNARSHGRLAVRFRQVSDSKASFGSSDAHPTWFKDLGTAEPSFTANLLDACKNITPDEEFDLKWSAASLYSGTNLTVGVHIRGLMS